MLSILLYFVFFVGCFLVDKYYKDNKKVKNTFVVLLYVFLCFGYMTGSDWRAYELAYQDAEYGYHHYDYEKGFFGLFYFLSLIIKDFFITLGILKCLYFFSLITLLKKITDNWLTVIGVMFTTSLLFMLIDNPLRFMVANIFVNFSLYFYVEKKYIKFVLLALCAPFFHTSTIFVYVIILIHAFHLPFSKINKLALIIAYIIFSFVFSELSNVSFVRSNALLLLSELGTKTYEANYEITNNEAFFTVGSVLRIILGCIVIYFRDIILSEKNGKLIYDFTIIHMFVSRIVLLMPSGFRVVIPIGIFYAISLAIIIIKMREHVIKYAFILIFSVTLFRSLNNTFTYIPYTNSIYYIIMGHKPYYERNMYNYIEYQNRTGHTLEQK